MRLSELKYISNLLSISRIILTIPIYFLLKQQTQIGSYLAVFLMLIAALTDAYDGRLARRLKQRTDLGRVLDPIADKIGIIVIAIILVKTRDLPLWFFVLVASRDLAIVLIASLFVVRTKIMVESNIIGKITVTALAITVVVYTLGINAAKMFVLWSSVGLVIVSSISYANKMFNLIHSQNSNSGNE